MSVNLQRYLEAELKRRKKKNPSYSIRSFARDLELDATALSRILSGKRAIGTKTAKRILSKLRLEPTAKDALLRSLLSPEEYGVPEDCDYMELTPEQVGQMDEWIYSALIALARSKSARLDVAAFATFFGMPITKVESYVKKLLAFGFIKKTETGMKATQGRSTAPYEMNSRALNQIKIGFIQCAIEAMGVHAENDLDISGITLLISKEKLQEASLRIKAFRRSLAKFLESDQGDDLFRLNIQLFPLKKTSI